jgi:hypothetical protein
VEARLRVGRGGVQSLVSKVGDGYLRYVVPSHLDLINGSEF